MLTLETKVRLSSSLGFEAKPSLSLFPRFNVIEETPREVLAGTNAEEHPARIEKIATVIFILNGIFLMLWFRLRIQSAPTVKYCPGFVVVLSDNVADKG